MREGEERGNRGGRREHSSDTSNARWAECCRKSGRHLTGEGERRRRPERKLSLVHATAAQPEKPSWWKGRLGTQDDPRPHTCSMKTNGAAETALAGLRSGTHQLALRPVATTFPCNWERCHARSRSALCTGTRDRPTHLLCATAWLEPQGGKLPELARNSC